MIPIRMSEIATVVGGVLHGDDVVVSGPAYLDSRVPVVDGLFLAIVGEHVDGHDYAEDAHAVLGSRPTSAPTVVVDDPVVAAGRLARHVLDVRDVTVFALTGSQGKTGTKDFLAGVLRQVVGSDHVVATTANHNNELGVPLTVLRIDATTTHLVVEMGARGIGHISYLCSIAPPDVAAVINVGSAHVGEFGGRAAIAQAKGEIVEALAPSGIAVLNADDEMVAAMAARTEAKVITVGRGAGEASVTRPDVTFADVELDELGRPSFTLEYDDRRHAVRLLTSGVHQVGNAAIAAAMAIGSGLDPAAVAGALSDVRPESRWRMEITERADGLVVINDAYNANPESMRAALQALAAIGERSGRRTVAVLGEMRELGDEHDAGHRSVGAEAARLGIDTVVVIGEPSAGIAVGAREHAVSRGDDVAFAAPAVVEVPGHDEAVAWLGQNAGAGVVVLVKASRGGALEKVVDRLLQDADDVGETEGKGR